MPRPHNILLLAFPSGQLLDIAGPLQMFAGANDELSRPVYRIEIAAPEAGPFNDRRHVRNPAQHEQLADHRHLTALYRLEP